ncbi:DUF885 domain-containing protein [Thalassotalea castellviae]|uniref:DUF885 domain-containing protein n=1 Tax=Thalassotalea castellviae TaxID=3075612 RepID=A0ABU3A5T8_9GAMM|nr:DUF885 domain-containing protein [Thalassotalea sp. W431]MDT0605324.1 DUF885 domain-containing protein [Thalassotalea sp. W431]
MKYLISFFCLILLTACGQLPKDTSRWNSLALREVINEYHQYQKTLSPFSQPGVADNNARLPDLSPQVLLKNYQGKKKIYQKLLKINRESLTQSDQINWSVLAYKIKNQLDSYVNKEHYMPLTAESGFHVGISWIRSRVQFKVEQDYQDYLKRMAALPTYFDQQMAWMDLGIKEGITQPAVVLIGFEESIKAYIKQDVTESEFYQPFKKMPDHFTASLKADLRAQAQQIIREKVNTSYQKFYDYMVNVYQPNGRQNIAANSLPNGDNYYKNRVEHYTTLTMSADEIHQKGLEEVARIRAEMEQIIRNVGYQGDFASFVEFLRTDPQFYATTPEELLKEASFIAKKMDAKLPQLFKKLPRTPYGVMPVPASIAPKYTTGRYAGPSREDQPGNYWVNTYRLDRRPLYVLEALTLHEAVPGHHLQGSLAKEMKNVPEFRNSTYISAFGEGWGLYSEFLGIEAGFYQDPYSDFGRLTYEMWRACRLVVDTGMHSKNWSRDRAMSFLADNTALSLHNVKTEIDRYISWPGQALSYKIGELTIKRLRKKAEDTLGVAFDLREFHDEVLKNGSMPLSMLEQVINQYITEKELPKDGK